METTQIGRARLKWHQADTLAANGKLEEAERTLVEARKMTENVSAWEEDELIGPNIHSSLALVQKRLGRHDRVLNTLKSLLKLIIEKRLSRLDHAVTIANIGTTLFFLGKLDISLTYTLKANKMLEKLANPGTLMQAAQDINDGYGFSMSSEEKRRLVMNQVPACYNLAIIYQHLGCTLESNKCLNAAKSLAISKIGFNNKITDLVTKNVELRSKEGKPVFLTQRFVNRNKENRENHRGPTQDIVDVDREVEASTHDVRRNSPDSGGKLNFNNFRNAMTMEDSRPQVAKDKYGFKDKLPQLNQVKLRNQMLRQNAPKGTHGRQYTRPQTDNSDWTPSYDANYPQAGMPKMISGGRPMSNGEVCGVRVTKLPPLYERPYGANPFNMENDSRYQGMTPFGRENQVIIKEPTYDLLRIQSSKSRNKDTDSLRDHQRQINQTGRPEREHHSLESGLKTPHFDGMSRYENSIEALKSSQLREDQSGKLLRARQGQHKTTEFSPSTKVKDQPLMQLGHFGFSNPENNSNKHPVAQEKSGLGYPPDSEGRNSRLRNDSLVEGNYSQNIYSSNSHNQSSTDKKHLNINRLQINMRYLS